MIKSSLPILAMSLCTLLCTGCNPVKATRLSDDAIIQFNEQRNEGQDDAIYAKAAGEFQTPSNRENLIRLNSAVRKRMGNCGTFKVLGRNFQTTPRGTFVTVQIDRSCAKGSLTENFVWQLSDDEALLLQYVASSPLLIGD